METISNVLNKLYYLILLFNATKNRGITDDYGLISNAI